MFNRPPAHEIPDTAGDGALDNPAAGERDETGDAIRSLDDLSFEMRQDGGQGGMKDWSLVGAVGEQLG